MVDSIDLLAEQIRQHADYL